MGTLRTLWHILRDAFHWPNQAEQRARFTSQFQFEADRESWDATYESALRNNEETVFPG